MMQTHTDLSGVRAVLFDMDGVIYVGNRLLPGVNEMFDALDRSGRRWMLITNNSTMTSQEFAAKLARLGVHVDPDRILGSAEATACWMAEQVERHDWTKGPVTMLGQAGLRVALESQGFEIASDPFLAAYAVSGMNFALTYDDLADIALAIRNGARFIATNDDRTYPTERGQVPGTGSLLALLTAATDVTPVIVGKPFAPMYEIALERLGVDPVETLMVGDRYETDIAGALKIGLKTAGVLTGIHTRAIFEAQPEPPNIIAENLVQLRALFG